MKRDRRIGSAMRAAPLAKRPAGSLPETLAGKHLLVTGASGFLGKVWLAMILDRVPEIGHLTVLIRGRKRETALARFERLVDTSPVFRPLRARHGAHLGSFLADRVEVVEGDVSRPLCGLDERGAARIARTLDGIVHFAGSTDFEPDPREAIAVNVRGAIHVADLAARTKSKRLLHVSTCFVAGNRSGEIAETLVRGVGPNGTAFRPSEELRLLEHDCDRVDRRFDRAGSSDARRARVEAANARAERLGFPNIYTYSKGLAEQLLAERDDVRTVVVRPAIVECAAAYPFPGWNEGINTSGPLFWLLSSPFRRLPSRPENRFDVVPVDTVARGLTVALADQLRDRAHPVYQLASSHRNPFTFGRAIELTGLSTRRRFAGPDATPLQRLVLRYLDAVPAPDRRPSRFLPAVGRAARGLGRFLARIEPRKELPPRLDRAFGKKLDKAIREASSALEGADRFLGRIEYMLRLYKPFIHDNDYVFLADRVAAASAALSPADRETFGFDIEALDWRHYWVEVQGPGLATWCFPLLRGKKAPEDRPSDPPFRITPAATHPALERIA